MTTRELYSSIGVSACKHEGCWRKDGIFHIRMEAPPSCHKCPKCGNREVIHRVDVYSRCACRSESGSKAKIKAVAGRHRLSFRNIDWLIHRSMSMRAASAADDSRHSPFISPVFGRWSRRAAKSCPAGWTYCRSFLPERTFAVRRTLLGRTSAQRRRVACESPLFCRCCDKSQSPARQAGPTSDPTPPPDSSAS